MQYIFILLQKTYVFPKNTAVAALASIMCISDLYIYVLICIALHPNINTASSSCFHMVSDGRKMEN